MNLPRDCIIKVCLEMDLSTVSNFIQTSRHNYKTCISIYNYIWYKEEQYRLDFSLFEKKRKILSLLENTKNVDGGMMILRGGTAHSDFRIETVYSFRLIHHFKFIPKYNLYHNNSYFNIVMTIDDPDIKLEKLRLQIYE